MRAVPFAMTLMIVGCAGGPLLAADAENGRTLAERWCVGCHVVSDQQSKGTDIAPSFASIAERTDFNEEKLAFFLLEPHPKMPSMALSRIEAKNLSAFIAEQKRP
ncbi:mono/diheme cytochrome c family protein [Rhodopseudomonas rhenobacensis]|uniref:Mono/diheme cytochrome c family protein n=1 Tax=Rhodopseudomonas rhenobacensis TaxID=87461 RepID=A0A7W8E0H5_9BRAD|nr:c-type cytochrome [Rhodopseudomonas rhenobacensis]MBB5048917.1 mono/diheme cytochrome c family protein [Rhodopseudomonas rhenobacensis]